jgi:hypothetical protein
MFAENLSVFFDTGGFAVAASWGAYSANVILDAPSDDLLGGKAIGTAFDATLVASGLPGIARGDALTIDSVGYVVREVRLINDGKIKRLSLQK